MDKRLKILLEEVKGSDPNLDYGYRVGRWNPTDGGSSVIMTSEGIKTSWDLAPDGSISKNRRRNIARCSLPSKCTRHFYKYSC